MLITNEIDLYKIYALLESHVIAFDTETTGLNTRKDKVIGFSLSDGIQSCYISHLNPDLTINISYNKCRQILCRLRFKKLLMFNGMFDSSVVLRYFDIDLTAEIYDVMLLAHTCDENQIFAMKMMAQIKLGIASNEQEVLKAEMAKLKTKDYYKVPLAIMAPYAEQDAVLTYKLYQYWQKQMTPELQELFDTEIMPHYKSVVIPMQRRGVMINVARMESDLLEISADIMATEHRIQSLIQYYLLPFRAWFYENEYPWISDNGAKKTRGKLASLQKLNPGLSDLGTQQLAFKMDGGLYEFNISSDVHLRKLFFETLNCTPLSHTDGGLPRADMPFLLSIADKYDFVPPIIMYNKLLKIKGTYIEGVLEKSEAEIFYPTYKMHGTTSGRLSGDMQQLPKPKEDDDKSFNLLGHENKRILTRYVNAIREYFIARPGQVFVDADFSSIEPRVFAALAGDEPLLNIFKNNEDFYSRIAIEVLKLEDVSASKKASNYLGKIKPTDRQNAKAFSLGIRYGLDDYKLHKDLNITQKEARDIVSGYFEAFPKLKISMDAAKDSILTTGKVKTQLGRVRRNDKVVALYNKHGNCILNALDLWQKYHETPATYALAKKDYREVREAINNAYNFEIQGMAAHILARASVAVNEELRTKGIHALIIASIHDQIIVECDESDKEVVAEIVQRNMENTTLLPGVDLEAIPCYGYNMSESKG